MSVLSCCFVFLITSCPTMSNKATDVIYKDENITGDNCLRNKMPENGQKGVGLLQIVTENKTYGNSWCIKGLMYMNSA